MRIFWALVDELGIIALSLFGLFLVILIFVAGISAGPAYAWGGALLFFGYIWIAFILRRRVHKIFRNALEGEIKHLENTRGFHPIVSVWSKGDRSFIGFDRANNLGVMLSYAPREQRVFNLDDIIGCNWTENEYRVDFQISLEKGTVSIPVPRDIFYDFKTRVFALTGMSD